MAAQFLGGAAGAQALHDVSAKGLVWRMKPSGNDMAAVYPQKAQSEERAGWAVVECQILPTGDLKDCQVLGEGPTDYGFGDAALKLAPKFKLDVRKNDPADLAGGVVAIPIILLTPVGAPYPNRDYLAGEPSALLTPAANGRAPCPTKAIPTQTCAVHRFSWATRPSLVETATLVRGAAAAPATTAVLCPIGEDMKLAHCTLTGPADPSQIAAMTGLIPLFTAPAEAEDKAAAKDGFVLVQFNWPSLHRAVETSVLTKTP